MTKVALHADSVNDLLAAPLRDQSLGGTGIPLLVLLVAVAILLFQSLRAVLTALFALLLPALVLLRSLVFVLALIAVIGFGMVSGSGSPPADPEPVPSSPTATVRPPAPSTRTPTRKPPPTPATTRSSLAAPGR